MLRDAVRKLIRSMLSRFGSKPELCAQDRGRLVCYYRQENEGLADWVGRLLPWRNR